MGALDYLLFDVRLDAEFAPTCIDRALGGVFDVANYKPPALQTYYVGWPGASDSNSGVDEYHSLLRISTAAAKPGAGRICLYPKDYNRDTGRAVITSKALSLETIDGTARIFAGEYALTWTLESGATSTYKAARALVEAVFDEAITDANDLFTRLALVGSYGGSGDLDAGTYYTDGTSVWVRTADSRDIRSDSTLHVSVTSAFTVNGGSDFYVDGVQFLCATYGVKVARSAGLTPTFRAKNCVFGYSTLYNGLNAEGAIVTVQSCETYGNWHDGFNYYALDGQLSEAAEIACKAHHEGAAGDHINNASTIHDACKVVRVGERGVSGLYYDTDGYPVADVNDGSLSLNYGCSAWGAYSGKSAWLSQCSGEGGMYLFGCDASQETVERTLIANSNGKAYTRRCRGFGNNYASGGGVITEYPGLGIPRIVG